MAKARAIVKRRKAVRNIKKITKTMQMIATAKFQKSLRRVQGTKAYALKLREIAAELTRAAGEFSHPLLRDASQLPAQTAVIVITSNRGLCGAYNGSVLRRATGLLRELQREGRPVDLYCAGKRGASFFKFQKTPVKGVLTVSDTPVYADVEPTATRVIDEFVAGRYGAVYVVFMNFVSTGLQKPEALKLLPLPKADELLERVASDIAEKEAQIAAGTMAARRDAPAAAIARVELQAENLFEFVPDAATLLDEVLPLSVKAGVFQAFLDATTSEHVARMVAMKAATDNADKMAKGLTLQYNRARQSQITTELSEIMGGVEAMK